jgi:hypothetical protein
MKMAKGTEPLTVSLKEVGTRPSFAWGRSVLKNATVSQSTTCSSRRTSNVDKRS